MTDQGWTTTPIGRLLQGHPMEEITKNMKGGPLTDKQGNPRSQYFFSLGISKQDPGLVPLMELAWGAAAKDFPGGQWSNPTPGAPDTVAGVPHFSWKILDGDAPEHAAKEGFPGCVIFRCTSGFAITCFQKGGAPIIADKEQIKRGYFVRASLSFKGNGDSEKPGIYVNCNGVELYSYGEIIQGGPDGAQIFGANQPAFQPQGMTAAPVVNPGVMPQPQQGGMMVPNPNQGGGMPQPQQGGMMVPNPNPGGGMPQPQQGGMMVPNPNPGGGMPQPVVNPAGPGSNFLNPPAPQSIGGAPVGYAMAPTAPGTYPDFIKAGWTDQQLVTAGHMIMNDVPY